jgi:hypothetical protein
MAKYRIKSPDGAVYDITAPDDATQDQVIAYAQQQHTAQPAQPQAPSAPPQALGNWQDTLREDFQKLSPTEQRLVSAGTALSNVYEGAKQLFNGGDKATIEGNKVFASERPGAALAGNLALLAPAALIPGANTVTGAAVTGGVLGAINPAEGQSYGDVLKNKAINTAIGATVGGVTQKIGQSAIDAVTGKIADMATKQSQNAVKGATLQASKDAGYVVPPGMTDNPGFIARLVEGFGGKLQTQQQASGSNQQVTNSMARQALGLQDDAAMTPQVMQDVRNAAFKSGYEPVKKFGDVRTDQKYASDLDSLVKKFEGASKSFPDAVPADVQSIVDKFRVGNFDTSSAIDATSILRDKASEAFTGGHKQLGKAYRGISDAIESQIERGISSPQIDDLTLSQFMPKAPDLSTMPKESIDRYIPQLKEMAKNAGWAETGGRIVRDMRSGEVVRRTSWVAKDPSWFKAGMGEADVKQAVKKLSEGQKLTKKEQGLVDHMTDFLKDSEARASIKGNLQAEPVTDYFNGGAKLPDVPMDGYTKEQWKLIKSGEAERMLKQFRDSRKLMAKTYSVEKSLNQGSGDVVASKLAGQLARGKPLSGELLDIAKFAQSYPKAAQNVATIGSQPGISPLDFVSGGLYAGVGAAGGGALGGGEGAGVGTLAGLVPLLRGPARNAILSKQLQSLLINPQNYGMTLQDLLKAGIGRSIVSSSGYLPAAAASGAVQSFGQ